VGRGSPRGRRPAPGGIVARLGAGGALLGIGRADPARPAVTSPAPAPRFTAPPVHLSIRARGQMSIAGHPSELHVVDISSPAEEAETQGEGQ
jgi:hypothetical protein